MLPPDIDADAHGPVLAGLRRCASDVLPEGQLVVLGVSGGSDSMALLVAAHSVLPNPLVVVHVQHGLRTAAPRDAEFVREACAARGIRCSVVSAAPDAASPGRGETAARVRRLAALQHAARSVAARHVLVAHHRDDSLETMLLNLERGHRGDRALAGIPVLRPLGTDVVLVHPFLAAARAPGRRELAAYRDNHVMPCIEDETNADVRVARNRVRAWLAAEGADVVPALRAVQARARARLTARVRRVTGLIEDGLTPDGLGSRLAWEALRPAAGDAPVEHVAEALRLVGACLLERRRIDPRAAIVDALRKLALAGHGELSLPATPRPLRVCATRDFLLLPDEALRGKDPAGRVLDALGQLPLHLP